MKEITHRDEVHGDIIYDPLAVALLNTESMQRLGRVHQLGYGHLVYRGGNHTRLSHVMGSYATAIKLVEALRRNYLRTKRPTGAIDADAFLPTTQAKNLSHEIRWEILKHLCAWAALLHDLGHVPMGHTLEDEFEGLYFKHDDFRSPRIERLWFEDERGEFSEIRKVFEFSELYPPCFREYKVSSEDAWGTVLLICLYKDKLGAEVSFEKILDEAIEKEAKENGRGSRAISVIDTIKGTLGRLQGKLFFPYMADIVGNTICADYLDYLQRDPRNLGLDVLRDDRVVSRFWVGKDSLGRARMALSLVDGQNKPRLDTCTGVVELVRQRYRFAEIVYYHKTKVSASAMLARVFHLIGRPEELPQYRGALGLVKVQEVAGRILSADDPTVEAERLRSTSLPAALLDVEIGDESLHLLLLNRAWEGFVKAVSERKPEDASRALQAVAILQDIARRKLYKVSFSVDSHQYSALTNAPMSDAVAQEQDLLRFLKEMREGEEGASRREDIERKMVEAVGWPESSLILYVPPRKSQAKGIETGALSAGRVVTLGNHAAVKDEVAYLSRQYMELWRLLVLVHPDYKADAVGLSIALDVFVQEGLRAKQIDISKMEESSWFEYIPGLYRAAARLFAQEAGTRDPDWKVFKGAVHASSSQVGAREQADRALLVSKLVPKLRDIESAVELVRENFAPEMLSARVDGEVESVKFREGKGKPPRVVAIERIAEEVLADKRLKMLS